jgi:hypothetical protein
LCRLDSEEGLQQASQPALEPERGVRDRKANAIFTWAGEWLVLGSFIGFRNVAAKQNGIAVTQAPRKDKG